MSVCMHVSVCMWVCVRACLCASVCQEDDNCGAHEYFKGEKLHDSWRSLEII